MSLIPPRTLKGFRDHLPESMLVREQVIDAARKVFRSHGYGPIDTPALEYEEILTGKGGTDSDRQMYRFVDHGDRRVGLRFDLTVPFARFAAQHIGTLGTPFKRYHIGKVWRGEKPHRGRYREFMQCDFDTIGTRSVVSDIETVLVIDEMLRAIGFERFTIRLNHRQLLAGLLEKLDLSDKSREVLRALDKLGKSSRDKVAAEMVTAGATARQADSVLALTDLAGSNSEILDQARQLVEGSEIGMAGAARLGEILDAVSAVGIQQRVKLNVAIARGLDYYTGAVFETFLDDLTDIGSICSGGRYDNLAELYTRQQLPGIGASLGLDRLLAAMDELQLMERTATPAEVFIVFFDADRLGDYLRLAAQLRESGLGVELFDEPKKLGQQLSYADRRGHQVAVIMGSQEFESETCQLKDLRNRDSIEVSLADGPSQLIAAIRQRIA
ncbi:MAG: histidine--tRNA ligase [Planctomycetales bacterium]